MSNQQGELLFTQGSFRVMLIPGSGDIKAVQELRFLGFFTKKGIPPPPELAAAGRDFDQYDPYCDHLTVLHTDTRTGVEAVVGCYRLMRREQADRGEGFYSGGEFDLQSLLKNDGLLELGRLCIAYREKYVLGLLLRGVAIYVERHKIRYLFGCSSQRGTNPAVYAAAFNALYEEGRIAPEHLRAGSLPGHHEPLLRTDGEGIPQEGLEELLDFYFGFAEKGGAFVSDVIFIDTVMNCIDLLLVVDAENLVEKVNKHFHRAPKP